MIIVSVNDLKPQSLRISGALVLADHVFLLRINIGIAVIYDRRDSVLHHRLYDGT
jgi:hypothetical protein